MNTKFDTKLVDTRQIKNFKDLTIGDWLIPEDCPEDSALWFVVAYVNKTYCLVNVVEGDTGDISIHDTIEDFIKHCEKDYPNFTIAKNVNISVTI